jgi:hypothetical protein
LPKWSSDGAIALTLSVLAVVVPCETIAKRSTIGESARVDAHTADPAMNAAAAATAIAPVARRHARCECLD